MLLYIHWETAQSTWQCRPAAHHPWEEVEAPVLVLQQGCAPASIALGLLGCPWSGLPACPLLDGITVSSRALCSELLQNSPYPMASPAKLKGNSTCHQLLAANWQGLLGQKAVA